MSVSENGLYPLNGHIFTAKMIILQWNSNGVPTRALYFQTSHLHLQLHGEAYSLVSPFLSHGKMASLEQLFGWWVGCFTMKHGAARDGEIR